MAKVTIYDAKGQAFLREPVDARECVESGGYFYDCMGAIADDLPKDESGADSDAESAAKPKAKSRTGMTENIKSYPFKTRLNLTQ